MIPDYRNSTTYSERRAEIVLFRNCLGDHQPAFDKAVGQLRNETGLSLGEAQEAIMQLWKWYLSNGTARGGA